MSISHRPPAKIQNLSSHLLELNHQRLTRRLPILCARRGTTPVFVLFLKQSSRGPTAPEIKKIHLETNIIEIQFKLFLIRF